MQRLREAGLEVPEVGGKTKASAEEENKTLKGEVRQLKDELDATRKGMIHTTSDTSEKNDEQRVMDSHTCSVKIKGGMQMSGAVNEERSVSTHRHSTASLLGTKDV